ncbi:MAG: hypothetical protein R6V72_02045 [Cyclobacterium sp.]|uniref:hypothetical protein n=1 Tax=unclassified Cyclobacterium TaxID=2615055 RepID=UPI0013D29AD8|nr:hypothetical protein [Cyclobacterium sp. SYSU L10401]
MKERLDSVFLSQLADDFLEIAKKFNDFRFEKISQQEISQDTFIEMGKNARVLMDTAREMKLLSTLIVEKETAAALQHLKALNQEIKETITSLKQIQVAFDLIGGLGALALAIVEKNPATISDKINGLMALLKKKAS